MQGVQALAPSEEDLPAGHLPHAVAPFAGADAPAGHLLQAPPLAEKDPASQGVHTEAPSALMVPGGQALHSGEASFALNMPPGHSVHLPPSEKLPFWQALQLVAPLVAGSHAVQLDAPLVAEK